MGGLKGRGRREQIRAVKHRVEDDLLGKAGVVAVDINEKTTRGRPTGRLAIVVSVRRKMLPADLPPDQLIPLRVEGIPTDVVAEDVVLHRLLLDETQVIGDSAPEVSGIIVGGLSIGPGRAMWVGPPEVPEPGEYITVGTLGALVDDRCGHVMGLTNFHVACVDDAWSVGDAMVHPSRVDGGRPGQDEVGTLARAALSGAVDGAVVQLSAGRSYESAIAEIGPVRGPAAAELGMPVRKRGRSTGLTSGVVVSVDATLAVDYGDGIGRRVLRDQIRVRGAADRFGDHGDSGAAVVDGSNQVVGLYFAGTVGGEYGFANQIGKVLTALDVRLCVASEVSNPN